MAISQAHVTDSYKLGHIQQYVPGTTKVVSNMTPRDNRLARAIKERFDGKMPFVGLQYALLKMKEQWQNTFFNVSKEEAIKAYSRRVKTHIGNDHGDMQIKAMSKLHDLGYLPIEVKALKEGSLVNMQIPVFTIKNTLPDFYWLVNYLETYLSCEVWPMSNACAIGRQYHDTAVHYANITGADPFWTKISHHCFAARGGRGQEDAMITAMGHAFYSYGSDTLWAIDGLEKYYKADPEKEIVLLSVNAAEHATATQRIAYYRNKGFEGLQAEVESLRDFLTNVYPTGIFSYVSDSEDYYGLLEKGLPQLKDEILSRKPDSNGLCKLVMRPDSSPKTPLEVICGDFEYYFKDLDTAICKMQDIHESIAFEDCQGANNCGHSSYTSVVKVDDKFFSITTSFEYNRHDKTYYYIDEVGETTYEEIQATAEMKGSLELLADTFGYTVNEKGFKVINPVVGLLYGEQIDIHLQDKIFKRMVELGWCVSNVLFGVGSWGFLADSSRDSFSIAVKGTHSVVDGYGDLSMQKTPKTAATSKKSAKGLLQVNKDENGSFVLKDNCTWEEESKGELQTVFFDGYLTKETTLSEIRQKLWG